MVVRNCTELRGPFVSTGLSVRPGSALNDDVMVLLDRTQTFIEDQLLR